MTQRNLIALPKGIKTHDVQDKNGKKIQIKTTQYSEKTKAVGLGLSKQDYEHLIVIQINRNGEYIVIYDGPGSYVSKKLESKSSVSLSTKQFKELDGMVKDKERVLTNEQRIGSL